MPIRNRRADLLLDTSVAIPFIYEGDTAHQAVTTRIADASCGLSGHAMFETFSVLTRMPFPLRLSPADAARVIATNFPYSAQLSATAAAEVIGELASRGIAGGAVYDGLVAAAAREHDARLLSRDRRAAETYSALGVDFELL